MDIIIYTITPCVANVHYNMYNSRIHICSRLRMRIADYNLRSLLACIR